MTNSEAQEIMQRVAIQNPQFIKLLEVRLNNELQDLPSANADKVQVFQGRCKAIQELLSELRTASGVSANRTAKPPFSTP
jgi:hypothetical protein